MSSADKDKPGEQSPEEIAGSPEKQQETPKRGRLFKIQFYKAITIEGFIEDSGAHDITVSENAPQNARKYVISRSNLIYAEEIPNRVRERYISNIK